MDIDNLQQNMNTRVVFKEPRGMVRWLQLFFAIIAFSTVADFSTNIGINITCPSATTTVAPPVVSSPAPGVSVAPPAASPATSVAPVAPAMSVATSAAPAAQPPAPAATAAPAAAAVTTAAATPAAAAAAAATAAVTPAPLQQAAQQFNPKLTIKYPFDFSQGLIQNQCPGSNYTYSHQSPLNGSPQFYVMTGVIALIYASASLVIYLFFSSTYESIPVWPVADLIIGAILCLFWFVAATSFSSGVTLLKSTVVYGNVEQAVCPPQFLSQPGASCTMSDEPSWKSLNVGLVSGYTSFFLWGAGLWFVYKETHFHTPRDTYGPR